MNNKLTPPITMHAPGDVDTLLTYTGNRSLKRANPTTSFRNELEKHMRKEILRAPPSGDEPFPMQPVYIKDLGYHYSDSDSQSDIDLDGPGMKAIKHTYEDVHPAATTSIETWPGSTDDYFKLKKTYEDVHPAATPPIQKWGNSINEYTDSDSQSDIDLQVAFQSDTDTDTEQYRLNTKLYPTIELDTDTDISVHDGYQLEMNDVMYDEIQPTDMNIWKVFGSLALQESEKVAYTIIQELPYIYSSKTSPAGLRLAWMLSDILRKMCAGSIITAWFHAYTSLSIRCAKERIITDADITNVDTTLIWQLNTPSYNEPLPEQLIQELVQHVHGGDEIIPYVRKMMMSLCNNEQIPRICHFWYSMVYNLPSFPHKK